MLPTDFLYQFDQRAIGLGLLVMLMLATELGFRRGRAVAASLPEASRAQLSTLQGAMIGLLALLLGFSFALSESRYEARRELVVGESNAIGSTYLRSRMLGEPFQTEVAKLLREYVDARIEYFETNGAKAAVDKGEQLLAKLWSQAIAAVAKNPSPSPTGLFVASLNELIDFNSKRTAARQNHVPEIVLWLLFFVAIGAMALVGHGCGVGKRRELPHTVTVALILSFVIVVIMDLDRPGQGAIQVSQASLLALRDLIK